MTVDDEPDIPELALCRARLDRAVASYKAFGAAWEEYLDQGPHRLITNVDDDGHGTLTLRRVVPMPNDLMLIVSEFLHHLRAALDNCLYDVAVISSDQNPPPGAGALQWPICDTPETFEKQKPRLKHLRSDIVKALEAIQPYRAEYPGWNSLRLLNELARVDRHRAGHAFGVILVKCGMKADLNVIDNLFMHADDTVCLQDGDLLISFDYLGEEDLSREHIDGNFEWEVDIIGFVPVDGPDGRFGRPWGPLSTRMRSMVLGVAEYTEGLIHIALNPEDDLVDAG